MSSALDPRLLKVFTVLAEELHFGRAAERLYVAQPAVSQQLQRLEDQLGARLFERSTQHVSLTPAGEAILPYARQAVAAAAAVERAAREAAASEEATLEVGLSPGVHYLAERALALLAESEPQIRVRAIAANTGSVARHVADGTLEIGLGFATAATPGVRLEALAHVPAVAAVATDDPFAARKNVALRELATRRFAQVDSHDGPGYNDAVRELCREAGFEPSLAEQASGPMAWETAVRSGDCVGLTTRVSAASTVRGIRTIELAEQALFRIDLLTPESADGRLSAAATSFAEAARAISGPVIRAAS
jgi:LysR family transcriptional regulator, benzoate and cis,cis-muconate-responsive activator of ben and cat genes